MNNSFYFKIVKNLRKKPVRVFHSAAITKRYDVFTLQTADGVTVLLQGYINRTLTVENGFPSQVFFLHIFLFLVHQYFLFLTSSRILSKVKVYQVIIEVKLIIILNSKQPIVSGFSAFLFRLSS